METRDLLIEIGTEELPPKALEDLANAFFTGICNGLKEQQITFTTAIPYATPRRLAVLVKEVAISQPDREVERRGPALAKAFNDAGQPTQAAIGFARSCGVEVTALEKLETDKGSWLIHRNNQAGQATVNLIPALIVSSLASLPIPKRMRWADLAFEFVRPVHWVVLLFGHEVITANIFGIASNRETRGHRFHHPAPLSLATAPEYETVLQEQGRVIVAFNFRRERIRELVIQAAQKLSGTAVIDEALLNEVTSLVELPIIVTGAFDEKFLEVPPEALIAAMKGHQKCFHLIDNQGKLLPRFIAVSNLDSTQPEMVQAGYERVIRPRLSDAAFFWHQDCAKPLENRLKQLETIVFQNQLGTLYEKSKRVAQLSGLIARQLGEEELQGIRAAQLSKCDLVTAMVGEFPELQGIMGEYYARHDGETEKVAIALREQYLPRLQGDVLPTSTIGRTVAIADRLDTLVGIFGIGQAPTGDKDPFGLRRAAISVLRIMIECELPLNLHFLLSEAQAAYPKGVIQSHTDHQVFAFMLERLRSYYQDRNLSYDSVDAVLACQPPQPFDIDCRIRGIELFRLLPAAESLCAANKRIHNILKKAESIPQTAPDPTYFEQREERQLYDQMERIREELKPLLNLKNYPTALQRLTELRQPIDDFFDHVMVMADNETVRANRLAFLQAIRNLFLQVADISRLQV